MIFDDFRIFAIPHITEAYCKDCGTELKEISNGFASVVLYCPKCENIYQLKLVKTPKKKIHKEFLEQCRKKNRKKNENKN